MADGLDRWRDFFRGAGLGSVCEVVEKAILVAAADEPQEFLRRRDRIAERLFNALVAARPPSSACHGCTGSTTVSQPPATPAAVAEDKGSVRRVVPDKDSKVGSSSLGAPLLPLGGHADGQHDERSDSDSDSEDDERLRRAAASNYGHTYDDDDEDDDQDAAVAVAEEEEHHPPRHEEDDQEAEELEALTNEIDQESQVVGEVLRIKELLLHKQDHSDDTLFDSLRRLQLMQLSVTALKATEIGRAVNGLRKHNSQRIRHLVQTLIQGWKILVDEWVSTTNVALADNSPGTSNPSVVDDDDEEEGLPSPPLDEGAFFAPETTAIQLSEFFDEMDEDGNLRHNNDARPGNKRENNGRRPARAGKLPAFLILPHSSPVSPSPDLERGTQEKREGSRQLVLGRRFLGRRRRFLAGGWTGGFGGMMNSSSGAGPSNGGSGDGDTPRRASRKPKYSKFTQQELPACKPILTPRWVISVFVLVGTIFVPIGVASLLASQKVVEIVDRYDDACIPSNVTDKLAYIQNTTTPKSCTRTLTVPKDMKQPIYVYYQLNNFYQNHRRYVKSRNDAQLNDPKKANETTLCDPEKTTKDGLPIVPCGLIAWSLFNDTYTFKHNSQNLSVDKKDISWKSDREHKFGSDVFPKNFQKGPLIGGKSLDENKSLSEQEDLIVWMRTAALPTFRKLYGRIYVDLKENDTITVTLENNYNTYSFGGKKKLVLSTSTWLGGKNDFLGLAYLTVGGLCFFLAFAFTLLYLIKPRKLGDNNYLSWNKHPAGH